MKYTEEEIVSFARSRIRFVDQQRGGKSVLGLMGVSVIAMVILLIQMVKERSEAIGTDLFRNEAFLAGIAMGILFVLLVGSAALCVVRLFSSLYGKEIEVCRVLVRLADNQRG